MILFAFYIGWGRSHLGCLRCTLLFLAQQKPTRRLRGDACARTEGEEVEKKAPKTRGTSPFTTFVLIFFNGGSGFAPIHAEHRWGGESRSSPALRARDRC